MLKITICPTCGSDKIALVRRDWVGNYQGLPYTVPDLEYYECPNCGEELYDHTAMQKFEAHSPAYARRRATPQRRHKVA